MQDDGVRERNCTKMKNKVRQSCKERVQSLNSGAKVRCGPTAEIRGRKTEMTSAAV